MSTLTTFVAEGQGWLKRQGPVAFPRRFTMSIP